MTKVCLNMNLIYSGLGLAICLQCARWVLCEVGYYSTGWPTAILLDGVVIVLPRAGPVLWVEGWIQWLLKVSFKLDCSVAALDGCQHYGTSISCRNRWEPIFLFEGVISPALMAQSCSWGPHLPYRHFRSSSSLILSCEHYSTVFVSWAPSESMMDLTYLLSC